MNLLITGGIGGIGRELLEALADAASIRLITVSRRPLPRGFHFPAHALHETGSILDEPFIRAVMRRHAITHVIHAAGARTRECELNPALAYESNILGTDRVVSAACAVGTVTRFIHLSSAAVYGGSQELVTERDLLSPSTNYAITKAAAELVVRGRVAGTSIHAAIVRPGFVVGRSSTGLLSHFLRCVVHGQNAQICHPGRFHLHWGPDLARAIIQLLTMSSAEELDVFHLPGRDCEIHALAREAALPSHENQVRIDLAHTLMLPQRLDWSKFQSKVESYHLTELTEVFRQLRQVPVSLPPS